MVKYDMADYAFTIYHNTDSQMTYKIFTSYFGNIRNIKDMEFISIARYSPYWFKKFKCTCCIKLAPSSTLLYKYKRLKISKDEYTKIYIKQLQSTISNIETLIEYFHNKQNNICLLCYEKPTDFCHRRILANWINSFNILKYPIKEYKKIR